MTVQDLQESRGTLMACRRFTITAGQVLADDDQES